MPYSHIRIAFGQPSKESGLTAWTAEHCDVYIGGGPTWDHSILYQVNPNIQVYPYYGGSGFNRRNDPGWPQWVALKAWFTAHPEADEEDIFYHYRKDVQYQAGDGSARENLQIVAGYALGLVPGFGLGVATSRPNSRVPHGHWGDHISLNPVIRPYQSTILSMQRSGGVVTVTTSAAHGLEVGDRIIISGAADSSFDDIEDITEVPSPTSFRFAQAGADLSTTGGVSTFFFLTAFPYNYAGATARTLFQSEGIRTNLDAAGNKTNGNFFDSWGQQLVYSADGQVPDGTPAPYGLSAPPNFFQEFYDDFPAGGDVEAGRAWLVQEMVGFFNDYRAALTAFRGDSKHHLCGNGDGVSYMMVNATINPLLLYTHPPTNSKMWDFFRSLNAGDVILIEGQMDNLIVLNNSSVSGSNGYWEIKWKNLWLLMDEGKRLIQQSKSTTWKTGAAWFNYGPNVWYTDSFNDSYGCPLTYYSGPGLTLQFPQKTLATVLSNGRFWWDPATRRLYAYSTTDPTTTLKVQVWGYERSRFFNLAMYYTFMRHGDEGLYQHCDWTMIYGQDTWSPISWWEGMAYDVGQPAAGGKDINGNFTTDIWGVSTETSDRGYRFWQESTNSIIYGRKLQKGMALFRPCAIDVGIRGTDPRPFTMPFTFRRLRGDGTLGPEATIIDLASGEGAILITNWGDTPPIDPPPPPPAAVKRVFGILR